MAGRPFCSASTNHSMHLATKHAQEIIGILEDAQDVGFTYVAFELRPEVMDLRPQHIGFFRQGWLCD